MSKKAQESIPEHVSSSPSPPARDMVGQAELGLLWDLLARSAAIWKRFPRRPEEIPKFLEQAEVRMKRKLLETMVDLGAQSASTLASLLDWKDRSTGELLEDLAKEGLVRRWPGSDSYSITEEGKRFLEETS